VRQQTAASTWQSSTHHRLSYTAALVYPLLSFSRSGSELPPPSPPSPLRSTRLWTQPDRLVVVVESVWGLQTGPDLRLRDAVHHTRWHRQRRIRNRIWARSFKSRGRVTRHRLSVRLYLTCWRSPGDRPEVNLWPNRYKMLRGPGHGMCLPTHLCSINYRAVVKTIARIKPVTNLTSRDTPTPLPAKSQPDSQSRCQAPSPCHPLTHPRRLNGMTQCDSQVGEGEGNP
jgi:hypothetical protein